MNGTEFGEEAARSRLTQAEAAEMIELWTRNDEAGSGEVVDLRDVVEALHISEAEGERLLAQIRRREVPSARRIPAFVTAALYLLLAASVVFCLGLALAMLGSIYNGAQLNPGWSFAFVAAVAWSLLWIVYYRRVIGRAFGSVAERIVRGKS